MPSRFRFGKYLTEQPASDPGPQSPSSGSGFSDTAILDNWNELGGHDLPLTDAHAGYPPSSRLSTAPQDMGWAGDWIFSGHAATEFRHWMGLSRHDLSQAENMIGLVDPDDIWASSILETLADASGQTLKKLHLKDGLSMRTVARVQSIGLQRGRHGPLSLSHAQIVAPGAALAEIAQVAVETCHLTVVLAGHGSEDEWIHQLAHWRAATEKTSWLCPKLIFLLPPQKAAWARHLNHEKWPERVQIMWRVAPMLSPASIWNTIQDTWKQLRSALHRAAAPDTGSDWVLPPDTLSGDLTSQVQSRGEIERPLTPAMLQARSQPGALDPDWSSDPLEESPFTSRRPLSDWARRSRHRLKEPLVLHGIMASTLTLEGLMGCTLVDLARATVIASWHAPQAPVEWVNALPVGVATVKQIALDIHRMGSDAPMDEVMITASERAIVWRLPRELPGLALTVVAHRHRTNLAMLRLQILDLENALLR